MSCEAAQPPLNRPSPVAAHHPARLAHHKVSEGRWLVASIGERVVDFLGLSSGHALFPHQAAVGGRARQHAACTRWMRGRRVGSAAITGGRSIHVYDSKSGRRDARRPHQGGSFGERTSQIPRYGRRWAVRHAAAPCSLAGRRPPYSALGPGTHRRFGATHRRPKRRAAGRPGRRAGPSLWMAGGRSAMAIESLDELGRTGKQSSPAGKRRAESAAR